MDKPTNNQINDLWRVVNQQKIFEPLTLKNLFNGIIPFFQNKGYEVKIEAHAQNGFSCKLRNVIKSKAGNTYSGQGVVEAVFWSLYEEIKNMEAR